MRRWDEHDVHTFSAAFGLAAVALPPVGAFAAAAIVTRAAVQAEAGVVALLAAEAVDAHLAVHSDKPCSSRCVCFGPTTNAVLKFTASYFMGSFSSFFTAAMRSIPRVRGRMRLLVVVSCSTALPSNQSDHLSFVFNCYSLLCRPRNLNTAVCLDNGGCGR